MSSQNAANIASNRGPIPQRFAIVQGPGGQTTYTEYGQPVSSAQFEADYFAYIQQNKAGQVYGIRQDVTRAQQAEAQGASQPLPEFFRPFPASTSISQEYGLLQSEQAYLKSNAPDIANPYAVGQYNSLVKAYNANISSYQSTIASENAYLQSLTSSPITASELVAGLSAKGITPSSGLVSFAQTNPSAQITVTARPTDPFNPIYGGSSYLFSATTTASVSQPTIKFPDLLNNPFQNIRNPGFLTAAYNQFATAAGYGGFFLSLTPRELYSVVTTGKGVVIPPPSQSELLAAGGFGLQAAGATALGFAVGPIAGAILPQGSGLLTTIAARAGVSAAVGGGYGATTSYLTGGDVLKGAGIGALSFAGSYALFEGGAALVSRASTYGKNLLINYVPDPSQNIEEPYNLNVLQRYINERFIQPSTITYGGSSYQFAEIDQGAKNFASMVSSKLGQSPYAATNQEFMGQLKAGYESTPSEPEITNVSSSGQVSIVRQQVQQIEQTQAVQQEQNLMDIDYARTQSGYEASVRIAASRGKIAPIETLFFAVPPGYAAPQISGIALFQPVDISLGSVQNYRNLLGLDQQSQLSLNLGLESLSVQSQVQREAQQQVQVQSQQQIQMEKFTFDTTLDLGLRTGFKETFGFRDEFALKYAVSIPDIFTPRRGRRRSRKGGFFEYVKPNKLTENVLAEPSIARVGALIFG